MAKPPQPETESLADKLEGVITAVARAAAILGGIATLLGLAGIILLIQCAAGDSSVASKAAENVGFLQKVLTGGLVLLLAGTAALFWSQEFMLAGHVVLALLLWLSPSFVPSLFGGASNEGVNAGLNAMQSAGMVYGALLLVIIVADVTGRVRQRLEHGAKADTLKYGKGIKEENDRKNVLLGNCWQLPYCRKFVREKCPIFHARRTCWRELVGCMCEEAVIRGAMESKVIPKDAVAAAKMIPRSNKLTDAQKRSRCKSCTIYNEHQRHKYRVAMPVLLVIFGVLYALGRPTMVAGMSRLLGQANQGMTNVTVGGVGKLVLPTYFTEVLVIGLMIVAISYAIRALEYALFKLKI